MRVWFPVQPVTRDQIAPSTVARSPRSGFDTQAAAMSQASSFVPVRFR